MHDVPARKRLRALLNPKEGRTQGWIAEKLGIRQQTVSELLRGAHPGFRLALVMERVFGIPPRDWFSCRELAEIDGMPSHGAEAA